MSAAFREGASYRYSGTSRKILAANRRTPTNAFDLNHGHTNPFHSEFPSSHLQSARPRAKFERLNLFQQKERHLKSWIAPQGLLSAPVERLAQTLLHRVPTKPRLTLTTDAFDDGRIILNKFTTAAEETPVLRS